MPSGGGGGGFDELDNDPLWSPTTGRFHFGKVTSTSLEFHGLIGGVRYYCGEPFGQGSVRAIYDEELSPFKKTYSHKPVESYSKTLNLTLQAAYELDASVNLSLNGIDDYSQSVNLSMTGAYPLASGVNLFTHGISVGSGNLNLYLESYSPPAATNSVEMSLVGSAGSGVFGSTDLSMVGGVYAGMNLFLAGDDSPQAASGAMNLYVENYPDSASSSVDMFVANSTVGIGSGLNLKIIGAGTWANSLPGSGSVNMYIERNTAGAVPMFLGSPWVPASGQVPMSIAGAGPVSSGVFLSIPNVDGLMNKAVNLYTHGF